MDLTAGYNEMLDMLKRGKTYCLQNSGLYFHLYGRFKYQNLSGGTLPCGLFTQFAFLK